MQLEHSTVSSMIATVLVVEDEPLTQLGLERIVSSQPDLEVIGVVNNGWIAIAKAFELKPDIILMDINLPKLNGIEATQQIKSELPDTKVVMLTSYAEREQVLSALSCGADAYCVKGYQQVEQLLTAIASVRHGGTYLAPQISTIVVNRAVLSKEKKEFKLSQRENEVLNLIAQGKSNAEIANQLYVSINTVKTVTKTLMNKLIAKNRLELVIQALRFGMVTVY